MTFESLFWRTEQDVDNELELRRTYRFGGRFQLLKRLGQGGFGQVWKAQDLLLNQEVALKISTHDLIAETLVLRRLPKNRYVSIFDYITDSSVDASAYSMELLERPWVTLDDYQREQLWPKFQKTTKAIVATKLVIHIAVDLLSTLKELHGKKHGKNNRWCHADIKPQNVYINGSLARKTWDEQLSKDITPFVKVGDLGLARQKGTPLNAGTPKYMAPEQKGAGCVSPATDLFAVAQTIASMIIGRPFEQEELRHVTRINTSIAERIPSAHIADGITDLLRKMTNVNPAHRGTSYEAIDALINVLGSIEDWKVVAILVSTAVPGGITLNDAADFLYEEFASSNNWRKRTPERFAQLKDMFKSMYSRGILSRHGHKYMVRT